MWRKTVGTLLALLCGAVGLTAQVLDVREAAGAFGDQPAKETPKTIYDRAKYRVLYEYLHQRDAGNPYRHDTGWMVLMIGEQYSMYMDYYAYQVDSIQDRYAAAGRKDSDLIVPLMGLIPQCKSKDRVVRDRERCMCVATGGLEEYAYEEPLPRIEWQLIADRDSVISGISCKAATAHFRGRDYVAWYAPEVPISDGPYKFVGLPGLIFALSDTQDHYIFTLRELVEIPKEVSLPIYVQTDVPKETRERIMLMLRNYCADPASGLKSMRGVTIPEETLKDIKPLPYNPIELE